MATVASTIMDRAASLLNDAAKTLFTYTAQIPYLNMALGELREEMERNDISTTKKMSAILPVNAGISTVTLPADLVEIDSIEEKDRGAGSTNFGEMVKTIYLPDTTPSANFNYWAYDNGLINLPTITGNKDIRINYIGRIQPDIGASTDPIYITNCESFLSYRTAGLCAEFIGENKSRADSLNMMSSMAIERALGIKVKSNQSMPVRRRPFLTGYR